MTNLRETIEYEEYGYKIVICPICGKETLDNHYICEECGWEYDGTVFEESFSSANNSTMKEYREKYKG